MIFFLIILSIIFILFLLNNKKYETFKKYNIDTQNIIIKIKNKDFDNDPFNYGYYFPYNNILYR